MWIRVPLPLLVAGWVSACAAPDHPLPSLSPRAAEAIDPRLPVGSSLPTRPADAALTARLQGLVNAAVQGDARFQAAAADAERLTASAGEPRSESWVAAQQAVSAAVAAREATTRALGDIDMIAATRLAQQGGIGAADLDAIAAAAARVAEIDSSQASRINRLQARLGS